MTELAEGHDWNGVASQLDIEVKLRKGEGTERETSVGEESERSRESGYDAGK